VDHTAQDRLLLILDPGHPLQPDIAHPGENFRAQIYCVLTTEPNMIVGMISPLLIFCPILANFTLLQDAQERR
jgi:hypothetical protein